MNKKLFYWSLVLSACLFLIGQGIKSYQHYQKYHVGIEIEVLDPQTFKHIKMHLVPLEHDPKDAY